MVSIVVVPGGFETRPYETRYGTVIPREVAESMVNNHGPCDCARGGLPQGDGIWASGSVWLIPDP